MALNAFSEKLSNITEALRAPKSSLPLGDSDSTHFDPPHVKRLPWFGTPVANDNSHENSSHTGSLERHDSSGSIMSAVPEGQPMLVKHHEAPVIQLFYDLFFVANLCTFTGVHEVNDSTTLKSYIGFFAILWFTWLQVVLFHLRFGVDSAFERICKAAQFGVMTGFAVVGPAYKVGWEADDKEANAALKSFQMLSIILMGSRIVLLSQYLWALIHLRKYKQTTLPLLVHVILLAITSSVFLGMYFVISKSTNDKCLIAFYVVTVAESGIMLLVAGNWTFMSFRRTNVVERIGLLTLIILGEGIIGLCGSIQKVGNDQKWGADVIGMIICGVVLIYCIFMLYFDQTEHEKVGTFRQQLWIMFHFPIHVSILFTVEGAAQLVIWRKLIDSWLGLQSNLGAVITATKLTTFDTAGLEAFATKLNGTFYEFYERFEEGVNEMKHKPDFEALQNNMEAIVDLADDGMPAKDVAQQTLQYVQDSFASAAVLAGKNMGVEAPHEIAHGGDVNDILDGLLDKTFGTVFAYFFVAAGSTLVLTAILFLLGRSHNVRTDYINVAIRVAVGLGLAGIALMNVGTGATAAFTNFSESPWMLPTVAISFVLIVTADNVLRIFSHRLVEKRREESRIDKLAFRE